MRLVLICSLALGPLAACSNYEPAEPLRGVRPSWRPHYQQAQQPTEEPAADPTTRTVPAPAQSPQKSAPKTVAAPAPKGPPTSKTVASPPSVPPARPAVPTGPALTILPPEPKAPDTLRLVRSDGKAMEQGVQIRWTRNQVPLDTTAAQVPGPHSKGRYYQAVVAGRGWQQTVQTVIVNSPPEFLGFGNLEREGDGFKVRIRARDADGDSLRLQLPARSPGIQVSGMKLLLDPELIVEDRSVPVSITDGEATAAFLYPVRLPR